MRDPKTGALRRVGYVLKGFPRLSESFIASEIYRLERIGVPLRLFVLKSAEERPEDCGVAARIRTQPIYLPPLTPLSSSGIAAWLLANLPRLGPAALRALRRWPRGWLSAVGIAGVQAIRSRKPGAFWPRRVLLKEFLQACALADELRRQPEVAHLHAHFCHGATMVAWLTAVLTGRSFSFTAHAKDIYVPSLNPGGLLSRKLRACLFAVTCTEANRSELERLSPEARLVRVYHGLGVDFASVERRDGSERDPQGAELRVLSVARRVPKKGLELAVEACGRLHRSGREIRLRLIGEPGSADLEIARRVERLGLSAVVETLGPLSPVELLREYAMADAFCLPCRISHDGDRDGIPNVIAEAMACGLPIVSTRVSGIPELVEDGVSGLLVPSDDVEALTKALAQLADDAELRRSLGRGARDEVLRSFDGSRSAAELAGLFREALRCSAGPGA